MIFKYSNALVELSTSIFLCTLFVSFITKDKNSLAKIGKHALLSETWPVNLSLVMEIISEYSLCASMYEGTTLLFAGASLTHDLVS